MVAAHGVDVGNFIGATNVVATQKPPESEVIVISSDEDSEEEKKKQAATGRKMGQRPVRKNVKTFSSVLTARSKVIVVIPFFLLFPLRFGTWCPYFWYVIVNYNKINQPQAACGLAYKPKDLVVDIDATDIGNELAAVEYIDDIYKFYKLTEVCSMLCSVLTSLYSPFFSIFLPSVSNVYLTLMTQDDNRVHDYMGSQPDINAKMRSILVDWLIEVHHKFELMPETLYLTINIVDRFLSMEVAVPRKELQLVGISSLLIACKYEEIWPPEVEFLLYDAFMTPAVRFFNNRISSNYAKLSYGFSKTQVKDLARISGNAYAREQVLVMEKTILSKLDWYLTVPTPYVFLVRYSKASLDDKVVNSYAVCV